MLMRCQDHSQEDDEDSYGLAAKLPMGNARASPPSAGQQRGVVLGQGQQVTAVQGRSTRL